MAHEPYLNYEPIIRQENREKVNTSKVFQARVIEVFYSVDAKAIMVRVYPEKNVTLIDGLAMLSEDVLTYKRMGPINSGDVVEITLPNGTESTAYAKRLYSPRQNGYSRFKSEYRNLAKAIR